MFYGEAKELLDLLVLAHLRQPQETFHQVQTFPARLEDEWLNNAAAAAAATVGAHEKKSMMKHTLKSKTSDAQLSKKRTRTRKTCQPASRAARSVPCDNLPVVVLWRGLEDVNGHSVAGVVGKAKHFGAHQRMLNE